MLFDLDCQNLRVLLSYKLHGLVQQISITLQSHFYNFGITACAWYYTSGVALLRHTKRTPCAMQSNQTNERAQAAARGASSRACYGSPLSASAAVCLRLRLLLVALWHFCNSRFAYFSYALAVRATHKVVVEQ